MEADRSGRGTTKAPRHVAKRPEDSRGRRRLRGGRSGEFFEVADGLVEGELVDAAVVFFAAGDGDGFVELGAARLRVALLTQKAALEDEDVSMAEVVAGFGDEFGGAGEGNFRGVEVGRVFVKGHMALEKAGVGFVEAFHCLTWER